MVLVTCMVLYNITNGQVIDIIFFSLICKDTETMSTRLKHTEAIKETKAWSVKGDKNKSDRYMLI